MKSITKKAAGLMVGTFAFAMALAAPGIGSADAATYSYYNCPTGNSAVYTNYSNCQNTTTTTASKVNVANLQSMVNKISQQYKASGSSNSCYSFDQVKNILSSYK